MVFCMPPLPQPDNAHDWRRRKAHEALDRLLDKAGPEVSFGKLRLEFDVENEVVTRYYWEVRRSVRLDEAERRRA